MLNRFCVWPIVILLSWGNTVYALQPDFEELVRASGILKETDKVLMKTNTFFYEGKKGFSVLSGGKERVKAYAILTQDALMVVDWSRRDGAYQLVHREDYRDLVSVEIAGGSFAVRLVTEQRDSGKFNSYELVDGRNALGTNPEKTREAKTIVAAGIQGYDVEAVAAASNPSPKDVLEQKQELRTLEERISRLEQLQAGEVASQKGGVNSEAECNCECPPRNE